MTDPRHPKQYPRGGKHPKRELTDRWKERVRQVLEDNRSAGRTPATLAALARMIGADKSGLMRVIDGDQPSYKYTKQICDLLGIEDPMVPNPTLDEDDWDKAVALARSLPPDLQRRALRILRAALDDVEH